MDANQNMIIHYNVAIHACDSTSVELYINVPSCDIVPMNNYLLAHPLITSSPLNNNMSYRPLLSYHLTFDWLTASSGFWQHAIIFNLQKHVSSVMIRLSLAYINDFKTALFPAEHLITNTFLIQLSTVFSWLTNAFR